MNIMGIDLLPIGDPSRFSQYMAQKQQWNPKQRIIYDKLIPLALFSVIGALGWAIRGTGGYGGSFGGALVGFVWGLLFYFLAYIRGIDARWATLFLGIGIAFGGTNGYGQQLSWIRGEFTSGTNTTLPIDPMIGYIWLIIIGLNWGGTAAVMLTWALSAFPEKKQRLKVWGFRILGGVIGGVIGYFLVSSLPQVFYPHYSVELYYSTDCGKNCARTMGTLPQLAMLLGIFIGLLIVEFMLTKDKRVISIALLGTIGFGFAFPVCANWWFVNQTFPYDWWKVWEESIGFFGGLGLGGVFLLIMKYQEIKIQSQVSTEKSVEIIGKESKSITVKQDWSAHRAHLMSIFVLFFVSFVGASENAMFSFGFELESNDDAEFPISRIILSGIVIIFALIYMMCHYRQDKRQFRKEESLFIRADQYNRMIYWITMVAFGGIIAIAYAHPMLLYLMFYWAILALCIRLNSFLRLFHLELN